jgi:hypothetical protein
MSLHAVSLVAVLVDQLAQAHVVVQCAQAAPEPRWKWLEQLLISVIPVAGGVGIAIWSVRATSKRDHARWVLENKKTEWQELLILASAIEQFMPSVAIGGELISAVHDPSFSQHLREMSRAALKCVFISEAKAKHIYEASVRIRMTNETAKGHIEDHNSNAILADKLGTPRPLQAAKLVQSELGSLWRDVRRFASEDLELKPDKSW